MPAVLKLRGETRQLAELEYWCGRTGIKGDALAGVDRGGREGPRRVHAPRPRRRGLVVDVVHDGVSGLWTASEFSYDVAILDIMLPGMNGYDVLKRIRERENWTPVIMLTAKDGEYDQTEAFDLGADDYLTKPFSFKVLVARLRA
jgi:CheY-like chemotaxis protein